ncbi:MAG TPA: hypothetical protein PL051_02385 [Candidatus Saccharibacteria bacterium]|nr:hypothetical protein [Candidatus Saccharibacteria bacterium]
MLTLSGLMTRFEEFAFERFGHLSDDKLRELLLKNLTSTVVTGSVVLRGKVLYFGVVDRRARPFWRKINVAAMPLHIVIVATLATEYRRRRMTDRELDYLSNTAYARQFLSDLTNHQRGHTYPVPPHEA